MRKPSAIKQLMAALDEVARTQGGAEWINGYRAGAGEPDESRLHGTEMMRWENVGEANDAFRRLALKLLREAKKSPAKRSRRAPSTAERGE